MLRVAFDVMDLQLGSHRFDITHRAVVMGIVGFVGTPTHSPDQSSGFANVLELAARLVGEGADALDVVGVPGAGRSHITEDHELATVVPVVAALRARFDLPLAIGTSRAPVAAACFEAGATIARDPSGFTDPDYLPVCTDAQASVVVAHVPTSRDLRAGRGHIHRSDAMVSDGLVDLAMRAEAAGIPADRIMVDPGCDLASGGDVLLELLGTSQHLAELGYRVSLSLPSPEAAGGVPDGASGADGAPGDCRWVGVSAQALGIARGCRVLRTHDARAARRVAEVMAAVMERR